MKLPFLSPPAKPTRFESRLRPDRAFFAIGDIHGRNDLLDQLLEGLFELAHPSAILVTVGDYIDRGDNSAEVLRQLMALEQQAAGQMVCLMGNHEKLLINFLDGPEEHGARWLRYGGLQTLASFGMPPISESAGAAVFADTQARLVDVMGEDLVTWVKDLPRIWRTGNVAVVHAGADPNLPLDRQDSRNFIWGHEDFDKLPRSDGTWVVHGHTVTEQAEARAGRISIDTGAYYSGQLTAALVEPDSLEFFSTEPGKA